jgi:ureidoglycolate lyase
MGTAGPENDRRIMIMREILVKPLSHEGFKKYGYYEDFLHPGTVKIGAPPIEFFRDMVPLRSAGNTNEMMFSICRTEKRDFIIDVSEYHNYTSEGMLPLDGDVLMHLGPATPDGKVPFDELEVFYVPKGTFVSINAGVWHHGSFNVDRDVVNTVIVLPERTYMNDCYVTEFDEKDYIKIVR